MAFPSSPTDAPWGLHDLDPLLLMQLLHHGLSAESSMWHHRVLGLIMAVVGALFELHHDHLAARLTASSLREALALEEIVRGSRSPSLSLERREQLQAYLRSLPRFAQSPENGPWPAVVMEQHDHLRAQIVRSLTEIEALEEVIDTVVGRQAWDLVRDDPAVTGDPAFQGSWYDRTAADHVVLLASAEPMPPVVRVRDWLGGMAIDRPGREQQVLLNLIMQACRPEFPERAQRLAQLMDRAVDRRAQNPAGA